MLGKVSEPEKDVEVEYVENDDEALMGSVYFMYKAFRILMTLSMSLIILSFQINLKTKNQKMKKSKKTKRINLKGLILFKLIMKHYLQVLHLIIQNYQRRSLNN